MKKKKLVSFPLFSWRIAAAVVAALILVAVLGLFLIPEQRCINGLNTLSEARWYADHYPELPEMDNTNMVRPDYNSFHRSHQANILVRKWRALCYCLGLHTPFTWSPLYFKSLLQLTHMRLKNAKVEKNVIFKITPTAKTRLVIIGDLSGAYHSLVRNLEKLKDLEIIDESMKLIAPDSYIVFMGDAISRSPYGMETLGLIMRLMEMNPETVVYMRGNHEDNKYWEAFGLKEQLETALGAEAAENIALINGLFMYLPLGLYLPVIKTPDHYVRISHLSSNESTKLKEDMFSHFLEAAQKGLVDRFQIDKTTQHNDKVVIDAIIHSEKKRHTYQASNGLRQLSADDGAIAWTVMSAPTLVNQKGFKCYDDAFVILQAADKKDDWTATLYSHDVRTKDDYKTSTFRFFTGGDASASTSTPRAPDAPAAAVVKDTQPDAPTIKNTDSQSPLSKLQAVSLAQLTLAIKSPFVQMLAGRIRAKAPGDRPFVKI